MVAEDVDATNHRLVMTMAMAVCEKKEDISRWKLNDEQKAFLATEFNTKRFPSPKSKRRLAEALDVEPRRIQVWFQNRRQREKTAEESGAAATAFELSTSSLESYTPHTSLTASILGEPCSPSTVDLSSDSASDFGCGPLRPVPGQASSLSATPPEGVSILKHVRGLKLESLFVSSSDDIVSALLAFDGDSAKSAPGKRRPAEHHACRPKPKRRDRRSHVLQLACSCRSPTVLQLACSLHHW